MTRGIGVGDFTSIAAVSSGNPVSFSVDRAIRSRVPVGLIQVSRPENLVVENSASAKDVFALLLSNWCVSRPSDAAARGKSYEAHGRFT